MSGATESHPSLPQPLATDAPVAYNTYQEFPLEFVVRTGDVKIVHPGINLTLLSFPALDPDPSGLPRHGISYFLAVNACHVLSNGIVGYIAIDAQGEVPVSCDDNFLVAGRYFYFVGQHEAPKSDYSIVKDFGAWSFSMPPCWVRGRDPSEVDMHRDRFIGTSASGMSDAVKTSDERCVVTKYSKPCTYFVLHIPNIIKA